jgi:hypothetical protein
MASGVMMLLDVVAALGGEVVATLGRGANTLGLVHPLLVDPFVVRP